MIRRPLVALGLIATVIAGVPATTSAAFSLALSPRDYPKGAKIAALPATNATATTYFGPVHRSTFDQLARLDGEGWVQAAITSFVTGRGLLHHRRKVVYAYGIHIFRTAAAARRALVDVKLKTIPLRVAHLNTRYYRVSDAHQTLVFDFFIYGSIETEAYYEYKGVAPTALAAQLRHHFSTESSHLVALTRRLNALLHAHPQPRATETPTSTATLTPTATLVPTSPPSPTATVPPTATPIPIVTAPPSPTATPEGLVLRATLDHATYAPGDPITLTARITNNGQPVAHVPVQVRFNFDSQSISRLAYTDADGRVIVTTTVPSSEPLGATDTVDVRGTLPDGQIAVSSVTFGVR